MSIHDAARRPRDFPGRGIWVGSVLLGLVLAALLYRDTGVLLDDLALLHFPYQIDYGEGIAWEHTRLMLQPGMYSPDHNLPFILIEYPPVYYLAVNAVASAGLDYLQAGRLVSIVATWVAAALIAALVLMATAPPQIRPNASRTAVALAAGLLFPCLHAAHNWGYLFRVDMLGVMLGLLGTLIGARAQGGFWGTLLALIICTASVYTKQTQLPAGIAVCAIALLRRPRSALAATAIAGALGLAALAYLQWVSRGGFLINTVTDLVNRMTLSKAINVLWAERSSAPFALLMVLGALAAGARLWRAGWPRLRAADVATMTRAVVLLHFLLSLAMLVNIGKDAGSFNYFLETLSVGCVLIGIMLCDLGVRRSAFAAAALVLLLGLRILPFRQHTDAALARRAAALQQVVQRIAAADKPVGSDDLLLLIRAGKTVYYEGAIVGLLADVGIWDAQPIVDMIRRHAFAFYVAVDPVTVMGGQAVNQAVQQAYPRVEQAAGDLWYRFPPP